MRNRPKCSVCQKFYLYDSVNKTTGEKTGSDVSSHQLFSTYERRLNVFRVLLIEKMSVTSKGRMCVVAGCSKRQSDGVSVHMFPKDERQRAAWIGFVKLTRADWTGPSQYTVICSNHFNPECYEKQCT